MSSSVKTSIAGVAIALAIGAAGAVGVVGTASAAVPADSGAFTTALQNPPHPGPPPPPHGHPAPPHANQPHRFRSKFRNQHDCEVRAQHDHPGRRGDWDCRRGPDRNNPWEYWGA